jgi:hypothetical protein
MLPKGHVASLCVRQLDEPGELRHRVVGAAQVAAELRKSKRKADVALGTAFESELVEPWREEEAERQRLEEAANLKAAQRQAAIDAGKSRSLRERKPVRTRRIARSVPELCCMTAFIHQNVSCGACSGCSQPCSASAQRRL